MPYLAHGCFPLLLPGTGNIKLGWISAGSRPNLRIHWSRRIELASSLDQHVVKVCLGGLPNSVLYLIPKAKVGGTNLKKFPQLNRYTISMH